MNNDNDPSRFLPNDNSDLDKLSVEIPSEQPLNPERIPKGFDPMSEIELRGQAYRGLAGGRMPWWILISGWIIFGFIAAVLLHAALKSSSLTLWIFFIIMVIPLFILGRGTAAKLSARNR